MQQNQEILRKAVNDALKEFGEPVMKTIVWHLNAHGIFLDQKSEVDIRTLYNHLEQIVGNAAGIAIETIYENLRSSGYLGDTLPLSNSDNDPFEPMLIVIEQLVIAGNNGDSTGGFR